MLKIIEYDINDFINRYDTNYSKFIELYNYLDIDNIDHIIAGGVIRRMILNQNFDSDWDFFFRNEDSLNKFIFHIVSKFNAKLVRENEYNKTFKFYKDEYEYKIQVIHINYFDTINDLLDSFDFTICQFSLTPSGNLVSGIYSLYDLGRKRLVLHKLSYAVSTLRRLIKYTKQGFYACDGTLHKILESALSNPDTINPDFVSID